MPRGRPKIKIDWEHIAELSKIGCSGVEICESLGIANRTLYERCLLDNNIDFSHFMQRNKAKGDSLLKIAQFEKAISGDNTMLIWLGKIRLGQTDKIVAENINTNFNVNVSFDQIADTTEEIFSILKDSIKNIPTD